MFQRFRMNLALMLFAASIATIGCKEAKYGKQFPVSGKVTVDGSPVNAQGLVIFEPNEEKGNKTKAVPQGKLEKNGNYTLATEGNDGAPPGWYKVSIQVQGTGGGMGGSNVDPTKVQDPSATVSDTQAINPKYTSGRTSEIDIEVVEKPAAGAYDIKIKK